MPVFLVSLIGSLAAFFGLQLAKKTVVAVAAIAAFIALTIALGVVLSTAINSLLSGIVVDSEIVAGFGLLIPSNAGVVIAAVFSAEISRRIYDLNVSAVKTLAVA